jgi:hypothetical protein
MSTSSDRGAGFSIGLGSWYNGGLFPGSACGVGAWPATVRPRFVG